MSSSPESANMSSPPESPAERRARIAAMRSSWLVHEGEDARLLGVSALIVVLRHMMAIQPAEMSADIARQPSSLFKLARLVVTDASRQRVLEMKQEAITDLCPNWATSDLDATSFRRLFTSDALTEALWSLHDHLLFDNRSWMLHPGETRWAYLPREPAVIVKQSLISYDGETDLGRRVSELFGFFKAPDGSQRVVLPNMPTFVRVLYTPHSNMASRYASLQHFEVRAPNVIPVEQDGTMRLEEERAFYSLVAAVRLRALPEEPDLVRTYKIPVTYVAPPEDGLPLVDDDWQLGRPGHSYMMLYARTPDPPDLNWHSPEVVFNVDDRIALLRQTGSVLSTQHFDLDSVPPAEDLRSKTLPSQRVATPAEEQPAAETDQLVVVPAQPSARPQLPPLRPPPLGWKR
ncbi:hypothetical protein GGR56DRAFT_654135 [Xylariaceae sp. FL0804]|nr:hypothetical protein GGR56DRAFT_654135 [Xylariaceae sp. FL0804]